MAMLSKVVTHPHPRLSLSDRSVTCTDDLVGQGRTTTTKVDVKKWARNGLRSGSADVDTATPRIRGSASAAAE